MLQVDFGCGSGSLLDSLLDYPTSLEKIVGIDISQKSLSRAAKVWIITKFLLFFSLLFICFTLELALSHGYCYFTDTSFKTKHEIRYRHQICCYLWWFNHRFWLTIMWIWYRHLLRGSVLFSHMICLHSANVLINVYFIGCFPLVEVTMNLKFSIFHWYLL